MNENEILERLSLVLLGIAIGVVVKAIAINFPLTENDTLIIATVFLAGSFILHCILEDKRE